MLHFIFLFNQDEMGQIYENISVTQYFKIYIVKVWNNAENFAIFVLEIHVWYIVTLAKSSEKDTM